jgi:HAE1 family hydrophobic/amphiphilic exporter-1
VKELDSIESMDIVEARMNIVGFSLLNNINGGSTFLRNQIKRLEERTDQSVDAVVKQLFAKTASKMRKYYSLRLQVLGTRYN